MGDPVEQADQIHPRIYLVETPVDPPSNLHLVGQPTHSSDPLLRRFSQPIPLFLLAVSAMVKPISCVTTIAFDSVASLEVRRRVVRTHHVNDLCLLVTQYDTR